MDTTLNIRERLEKEMTEKLQPFVEECQRRGYPLENFRVLESVPGVHDIFIIRAGIDWADAKIDAIDILFPILKETTPKEVHHLIWGICPELPPIELRKKFKQKQRKTLVAV